MLCGVGGDKVRSRGEIGVTVITVVVLMFFFMGSFNPKDYGAFIERDSSGDVVHIEKNYYRSEAYTIIREDEQVTSYDYYRDTEYKGYNFKIYYNRDLFRRCYKGEVDGKYIYVYAYKGTYTNKMLDEAIDLAKNWDRYKNRV